MDFEHGPEALAVRRRLQAFVDEHVTPSEATHHRQLAGAADRWQPVPIVEELKPRAREAGLWNLFLPGHHGAGLSNLDYAPLAEIMGRVSWCSEVFNCSAPDTGNMETLALFGNEAQQREWLEPLLAGEIRSAFCMTEPEVASSDATNIQCRIRRDGDEYVIDGRKWWSSGAGDPRCRLLIVMGKTDPHGTDRYRQQSMVLVPRDTPGVTVRRMLPVFGYDDAPHGHAEITFEGVRVPAENILLGEGRGFEIAQGRLGPGRIHHCMRAIGMAERALEMTCRRALDREPFGKPLAEQGVMLERIAESIRQMTAGQPDLPLHLAGGDVDARTVICVLTHDPKFDVPLLEVALRTPAGYIGAMGSRRTHDDRLARLRQAGLTEAELGRLRSPIGLDLGARAAELIQRRWGGTGQALTGTAGRIHHPLAVR